jgi:hypothetical protein
MYIVKLLRSTDLNKNHNHYTFYDCIKLLSMSLDYFKKNIKDPKTNVLS